MTSMVILVVLENSSKEILPNIDQVAIKEENSSEILLPMNVPMESNIEADLSPLETSSSHNPSSSDHPSIASQLIPESASSSRSNSRTSSETKTETIKVNSTELPKLIDIFFSKNISASTSSTTLKYHVYFSPKNSITPTSSNSNSNKIKPKRRVNDEMNMTINWMFHCHQPQNNRKIHQHQLHLLLVDRLVHVQYPILLLSKKKKNHAGIFFIRCDSIFDLSFRFSAMLSENPNSWQSQSMAIIQFLLA